MDQERRAHGHQAAAIRRGDHGPFTSLRWVSTLFKSAAVFLAVAIFAEFIAGLRADGWRVMPFLLGEVARAVVLTILLWAGGDLIRLLLQISKDLRAERVLLARIAYRTPALGAEAVPVTQREMTLGEGGIGEPGVDDRGIESRGIEGRSIGESSNDGRGFDGPMIDDPMIDEPGADAAA